MATDILHDPEVRRWLGGVEPAWTLLDVESLNALRREPSKGNRAVCLAAMDVGGAEDLGPARRRVRQKRSTTAFLATSVDARARLVERVKLEAAEGSNGWTPGRAQAW